MKALSIILSTILLSCQLTPLEEVEPPVVKYTTLQIQNKITLFPITEFIDGSLWEAQVYCFCGKNLIESEIAPVPTGTTSLKINLPADCESVKVSWKFAPIKSKYYFGAANCRRYSTGQQKVKKESNTLLIVDQNWSVFPEF